MEIMIQYERGFEPPRTPIVALDTEDGMEGLGDRIANLTLAEASELVRYLTRVNTDQAPTDELEVN